MAASKTYSAGTAYITIVPSFLGLEDAIAAGIRDAAAKADKNLAQQMAQGLKNTQQAAKNGGTKAGTDFASAYDTEVKKRLGQALKDLPEPQPGVNMSKWDTALEKVRGEIKQLAEQRVGIDIDQKTFDKAIDDFRKKLEALRDSASGPTREIDFFNADQAAQQLSELQRFADEASRRAGAAGEQVGSAFDQRFRKVLSDAVDKIPPIKVTADSSDAERTLAGLRDQLVELQSKRIGVDIDAGDAYAELKLIQEELEKLNRKNVEIDVRTNAREAASGMESFIAEAEKADQATANIGNGANFSMSRLEYLIALGATLGTAIVPAAAAAAGAIGTIGTMAAAALSGVGVFALGISGISDAVKALNQYAGDEQKSANSVNQANRQMASSTDQVTQAQAALANTRRTVAQAAEDAARRVTEAERGVSDARREAAQEEVSAAQAVKEARQSAADAERAVADARRENARDLADADRQVRDAQRSVTDAEQNAVDVRQSLNQAIQDAVRNMEELTVSLQKNEADQESAVADQMKALDELNKLKSNPRATQQELLAAKAAYDEQTAQIADLKQKHKELADDQAKYDKKGVEADDGVIAARKKIADADQAVGDAREKLAREEDDRRETQIKNEERLGDAQERAAKAQEAVGKALVDQRNTEIKAQERIADAERQVDDARRAQARQQQDGQYQIRQAINAVSAAQRSQQQAWEKTGIAGGDALNTLKQKMADLSPIAQNFAKFIFGLKGNFLELRQAASDPLLPGLQDAITILLQYLPRVESFVSKVAAKLGELAVRAAQSLGDPVFQRFFNYIDKTAVPAMEQMFEIGKNLTEGLVNLFLALTPFNNSVGNGLVTLSADFAKWADTFDKTQGYEEFLAYIKENGPEVVDLLKGLGQFAISLIKASAPLGSIVLKVLVDLVDLLNSIPTGDLTILVFAIGTVAAGLTALGGVMRVLKLRDQLTQIFGPKTSSLIQTYAVNTGRATTSTSNFGKAVATAGGISTAAQTKLQTLVGTITSLPGKFTAAANGAGPLAKAIDAVRSTAVTAATAVSTAATTTVRAVQTGYNATKQTVQQLATTYSGPGGLARALDDTQSAAQRAADAIARTATNAATGTLAKAKATVYEVAAAYNGPGGLAAAVQTTGGKFSFLASGASTAAGKLGVLAKAAGNLTVAAGSKLKAGLGGLTAFLGGPWSLALSGATIAISTLANASASYNGKIKELSDTLFELGTQYKDLAQSGKTDTADATQVLTDIANRNPAMQQAILNLNSIGVSIDEIGRASAGSQQDLQAVLAALDQQIDLNEKKWKDQSNFLLTVWSSDARATSDKLTQLRQLRDAVQKNADQNAQAAQVQKALNTEDERAGALTAFNNNLQVSSIGTQQQLLTAYDQNAASIKLLNDLTGTFNNVQSTAAQRADAVKTAIQGLTGAAQDASEANETLAQKTINLRDQVNQAKAAHDRNATSLSLSSQTALRNRDALEDVARSIRDMYIQDIAAGKPLADVTKAHNNRINALKEEAKHLGLDKKATDDLIKTYGDVPNDIKTTIKMDPNSFNAVYTNLQRMQFMQSELKIGRTADQAEADWNDYKREMNRALLKADGGAIYGPGTATSDSIPARLSNGEHVWTADEVDQVGGQRAMYAMRAAARAGQFKGAFAGGGAVVNPWEMVPKFAKGGSITVPYQVNVNGTWVPDEAWVNAHTEVPNIEGTFKGLSPDASVAKLQKWALAQRGKRYLWAAVGPEHYDCSGLVGNLVALATGKKLYRRYMTTDNMGPGRHGMVAGPGKKMTIYLGPGHTAAVVGGLHAEAYGGNGTPLAIGRIGTRLSYYNQRLHLPGFAQGGEVSAGEAAALKDPRQRLISFLRYGWPEPPAGTGYNDLLQAPMLSGQFDSGGFLPAGYSAVLNATGKPEPVLTGQQWQDISTLARQAAAGKGGDTYTYEFRDTTLTPAYIRAQQDREAIRARAGLPV